MNNTTLRDDLRPAAADIIPAQLLNDLVESGGFGWPVSGDLTTIEFGIFHDLGFARTDPKPRTGITSGRLSPIDAGICSIAVLWNLDAAKLNADVKTGTSVPVAVDGDAHLRARASLLAATEAMNKAWAKARADYYANASGDREAIRRTQEIRDRYREAVAGARTA